MKKCLTKGTEVDIYHYEDGVRIHGKNPKMTGNVAYISGDVTFISGDVSNISGDVSNILGNVSGISGDVTYISGNIDDCDISDEERAKGVNITDLIE